MTVLVPLASVSVRLIPSFMNVICTLAPFEALKTIQALPEPVDMPNVMFCVGDCRDMEFHIPNARQRIGY